MKRQVNVNIIRGGKYIHVVMFARLILAIIGLIASIYLFFKDINGDLDGDFRSHILLFGILVLILGILHLIDKKYITKIRGVVPITRCNIIDKNIRSKSDILSDGIISTNPNKISIFSIHIEIGEMDGPVTMRTYKTKEHRTIGEAFTKIEPKSICDMDFLIKPEERFNFQFDKSGILKKMVVTEIYAP